MVDVGCGTGHLLAALARRLPDAQMVGVDYSRAAIALLGQTLPEVEGVVADIYDVSLPSSLISFSAPKCSNIWNGQAPHSISCSRLAGVWF